MACIKFMQLDFRNSLGEPVSYVELVHRLEKAFGEQRKVNRVLKTLL